MIESIKKKLEALLDSLLEPIWQRILAMSWPRRLLVLIIILGVLGATSQPQVVADAAEVAFQLAKVSLSSPKTIPLSSRTVSTLQGTATRLARGLQTDLLNPSGRGTDKVAWVVAQALVASKHLTHLDARQLSAFFRSQAESTCSCWKEIPAPTHPKNVTASGWVLYALADLGVPSTSEELHFFLDEQNRDGWWSVFPVDGQPEYASTYGTSWAMLALSNHRDRGLIPPSDRERVQKALTQGASWLITNREPTVQPRWKDYPLAPKTTGRLSESLSGLALHTLHRTAAEGMLELDRQWLTHLPTIPPGPSEGEQNLFWIASHDGHYADYYIQIRLPWLIIATVDAYPNGTLLQRVKAFSWLDSLPDTFLSYYEMVV